MNKKILITILLVCIALAILGMISSNWMFLGIFTVILLNVYTLKDYIELKKDLQGTNDAYVEDFIQDTGTKCIRLYCSKYLIGRETVVKISHDGIVLGEYRRGTITDIVLDDGIDDICIELNDFKEQIDIKGQESKIFYIHYLIDKSIFGIGIDIYSKDTEIDEERSAECYRERISALRGHSMNLFIRGLIPSVLIIMAALKASSLI